MLLRPEITMRDTILFYLTALRTTPALADGVFANWEAGEIGDIKQFITDQLVPVRLGYPKATPELPGIYCVASSAQESLQLVGGVLDEQKVGAQYIEQQGSFFQMRTRAMCVAQNADLTVVLQSLVMWAMIAERPALSLLPIQQQNLQLSDFEPVPQFFPDLTYRRDVTWAALIAQTIPQAFSEIASIHLTAKTPENLAPVTVVIAR